MDVQLLDVIYKIDSWLWLLRCIQSHCKLLWKQSPVTTSLHQYYFTTASLCCNPYQFNCTKEIASKHQISQWIWSSWEWSWPPLAFQWQTLNNWIYTWWSGFALIVCSNCIIKKKSCVNTPIVQCGCKQLLIHYIWNVHSISDIPRMHLSAQAYLHTIPHW